MFSGEKYGEQMSYKQSSNTLGIRGEISQGDNIDPLLFLYFAWSIYRSAEESEPEISVQGNKRKTSAMFSRMI